jgi:hypothetical protein
MENKPLNPQMPKMNAEKRESCPQITQSTQKGKTKDSNLDLMNLGRESRERARKKASILRS